MRSASAAYSAANAGHAFVSAWKSCPSPAPQFFHDAAVQTNGVDDPVKQRADTRIRLANNLRYFPSRVDGLRSPFLKLWDISIVKQVPLNGRVRAQFNIEFLNAFNTVVFNDAGTDPRQANFGKVSSQNNLPRDIQLAAKIVF